MDGTRTVPGWTRLIEDDGQGLTEYALILLFVSIVLIAALTNVGDAIEGLLSEVGSVI